MELTSRLNAILAGEWACVRALRRAKAHCNGERELIEGVLGTCHISCVELESMIRDSGGLPADDPNAPFRLKPLEESLDGNLRMVDSAQKYIVTQIDAMMREPVLDGYSVRLLAIRQFHVDNILQLAIALGTETPVHC